jgi:hypothetical protein
MIVSRTLVEHLADVDAFVANTSRALAPGGYTIHLVPGCYSLFALAGRASRSCWRSGSCIFCDPK